MNKKNMTLVLGVLAAFTVGSAFANDLSKTKNLSTGTLVAEGDKAEKSCKSCSGKKDEKAHKKGKKKDKKKAEKAADAPASAPAAEEKH